MEILIIKDLEQSEIINLLLFENYNDRSKAKEILINAGDEWFENDLESFIHNYNYLDEEIKPNYQHLLNLNSKYEYQLYCLNNSNINYMILDIKECDILFI